MRIRKNARVLKLMLSSSAYPPEAILQTTPHVCQLNQSPWDVRPTSTTSSFPHPPPPLPPPSNSTSSSYPTPNQLEGGQYSLSGNASIGDAIAVVESVESMKEDIDEAPILLMGLSLNTNSSAKMTKKEAAKDAIDDNDDGKKKELEEEEVKMCNKTNGKGWQCKKAAKKGYSSCERHNNNNDSSNNNNNNNTNSLSHRKSEKSLPPSLPPPPPQPQSGKVIASGVKRRGRGPGKKASTSNPYEFYYYSGFGPLWGKRRGAGEENKRNVGNVKEDSPSSSSQQIEQSNKEERAQVVQFMEDEDDDEDDSGGRGSDDNGRKRARKPVKARSLKSLM